MACKSKFRFRSECDLINAHSLQRVKRKLTFTCILNTYFFMEFMRVFRLLNQNQRSRNRKEKICILCFSLGLKTSKYLFPLFLLYMFSNTVHLQ